MSVRQATQTGGLLAAKILRRPASSNRDEGTVETASRHLEDSRAGSADEQNLLERLRAGDQRAFRCIVELWHGNMVRLARAYVHSRDAAEEVAQDTWVAVIQGLHGFEQRSSLKAWIYAILVHKARSRGVSDHRMIAFSELSPDDTDEPAVEPGSFSPSGQPIDRLKPWGELTPEREVAGRELLAHIGDALERLPPLQRSAIILRDIEGLEIVEACKILSVSETNYYVLLHRGRSKLRHELDRLLAVPEPERDRRHG